ncbi:MAG: FAD binding domain-containing protein [Lachnospiraceae bacterium]|nr:FAD binding domain-containing protein [Lachnospiraceae bacterium]
MEGELIKVSGLQEALALKGPDAAFFAGGTGIGYKDSGIHAGKLIVIPDIQGIRDISEEDGYIRIGALVTFTDALECPLTPAYLKEALRFCGSLQKRNMATVGGNVASWRCDSYLIPTLMASGAVICLEDKDGSYRIGIDRYADERDRYADALITAVMVKAEASGDDADFKVLSRRYANTVESHAYLTIAMGRDDGEYRIGLAVKGSGIFHPDIMNWGVSWKMAHVRDDMFGTEEYKRYITCTTLEAMYEDLGGEGGSES